MPYRYFKFLISKLLFINKCYQGRVKFKFKLKSCALEILKVTMHL